MSLLGLAARLVAARGCFSELVGDILVEGERTGGVSGVRRGRAL